MVYALGLDLGGGPVTAAVSTPEGVSRGERGAHVHVHPAPAAVVDGLLDRLGDPVAADGAGSTEVRLAELVVACVRTVADARGEEPGAVTVAHPTSWGPYRVGMLRTALAAQGLSTGLVPAATAAVAHAQDAPGVVAVLDVREDHLEVGVVTVAAGGLAGTLVGAARTVSDLGSVDVDDAVVAHVRRLAFPGTTPLAPTPPGAEDRRDAGRRPGRTPQHRAGATEPAPSPDADADATQRALAHRLRLACADAAAELVTTAAATVVWEAAGERHEVRVVAGEVDDYVRPRASRAIAVAAEAVAAAAPAGVDRVLLVGRIAAMPLLTELVSERFEAPVAVMGAGSAAVARGAARVAQDAGAAAATAPAAGPAGASGRRTRGRRAHVRHARRRPASGVTVLGGGVVALGIAALAVWGTAVASPGSPAQGHATAVSPAAGSTPTVSPSAVPTAVLPAPTGSASGLAGAATAGPAGSVTAPGPADVLGPPPVLQPPTVLGPGAPAVARTGGPVPTDQPGSAG